LPFEILEFGTKGVSCHLLGAISHLASCRECRAE
jgi:hypothetical protein